MEKYYWSLKSWGEENPPENASEIIDMANDAIDRYIRDNPDADEDTICAYSEKLWEEFCADDWARKALATIVTDIGTMTIYFNGPGIPLTAEKDDVIETLEFTPFNLKEAENGIRGMYGNGWYLKWL